MVPTVKSSQQFKKYHTIWLFCLIIIIISFATIFIVVFKNSLSVSVSQNAHTVTLPSNNGFQKDRSFEIQLYGTITEKTPTTLTINNSNSSQTVRYGKETTFQAANLSIVSDDELSLGMPVLITVNIDYSSCQNKDGCGLGGRYPNAGIVSLFIPGEIKDLIRPIYHFDGAKSGLSDYLVSTAADATEKVSLSLNCITKILYAERFLVAVVSYDQAKNILTISDSGTVRQLPLTSGARGFRVSPLPAPGSLEALQLSDIKSGDRIIVSGSIEVPLTGALVKISDVAYSTIYLTGNDNEQR